METIQFGVTADVQYAQKESAGGRHYSQSLGKLAECVDDLNGRDLSFVIQLGDFIDGGKPTDAKQQLQAVAAVYQTLEWPGYHVLGNHDFVGLDRKTVSDILELEASYYHFDAGQWRFVVLDTQDLAIQGGWEPGSEKFRQAEAMLKALRATGADNAHDWNGGIGPEQKQWLTETLETADRQRKNVIVFGHLPLMELGESHTLWNAEGIATLLEKHDCVKAYLNGHRHSGGYTKRNGIHYVTIEGMVDAADDEGAWAVVTLSKQQIVIEGVGAATNRVLEID